MIAALQELSFNQEDAAQKLASKFALSFHVANEKVKQYWVQWNRGLFFRTFQPHLFLGYLPRCPPENTPNTMQLPATAAHIAIKKFRSPYKNAWNCTTLHRLQN